MKKIIVLTALLFISALSWAATDEMPQETLDQRQAFLKGAIVVKGEGAAPSRAMNQAQKRLMALRAAKVVALREATEILDGVSVYGDTTVENAAASSDMVRTTVEGLVRGAQVIEEVYDPVAGMAVVYVSVPLPGVAGALLGELKLPGQPYVPMVTVKAEYDGVIIDAREKAFKPALINRLIAPDGSVIYDPSKVAHNILVQKGAAEYTNDMGKARAILSSRGASNPFVVKASGVVKSTDVELSAEEATSIFSANQAGSFLEAARVVFVLD